MSTKNNQRKISRLSCYVFCICCKNQKYKPAESIKNNQGRGTFKLMRNLKLPKKKNMSTKNILCRPKTIREGSPLKLFSSIWRWRDKRIRFGNFMNWTISSVKSNRQEYPIIVRNLRFLNQKAVFDSNHTSFSQQQKMHPQSSINLRL